MYRVQLVTPRGLTLAYDPTGAPAEYRTREDAEAAIETYRTMPGVHGVSLVPDAASPEARYQAAVLAIEAQAMAAHLKIDALVADILAGYARAALEAE